MLAAGEASHSLPHLLLEASHSRHYPTLRANHLLKEPKYFVDVHYKPKTERKKDLTKK